MRRRDSAWDNGKGLPNIYFTHKTLVRISLREKANVVVRQAVWRAKWKARRLPPRRHVNLTVRGVPSCCALVKRAISSHNFFMRMYTYGMLKRSRHAVGICWFDANSMGRRSNTVYAMPVPAPAYTNWRVCRACVFLLNNPSMKPRALAAWRNINVVNGMDGITTWRW